MTVALTGATGYLGRFIAARLLAEGVPVRAWRRPGSDIAGLPSGIEWIEGGLESRESAVRLVSGADMLVHAALQHQPGRYRGGEGRDLPAFLRANVCGSLALLAEARDAGVRRCVVLSSRAVFGARPRPGPIPDDAAPAPDTHYGAAKAALEAFVQSWGGGEGWAIAALRPTGIYGLVAPAERSKWFDSVGSVLRGDPVPARAGTEVHGGDVAEAVWRLLTADPVRVAGRCFNCSDITLSTRDLVQLVQRIAGVSGPVPDAAPAPANVMDCAGLRSLGVTFGGWPLLERTVADLVAAAAAQSREPAGPA